MRKFAPQVFDAEVLVTADRVYIRFGGVCSLVTCIVSCAGRLYCTLAERAGLEDRFPTVTKSVYGACEPPADCDEWRSVKFTAIVRDERGQGDELKCGVKLKLKTGVGSFESLKSYAERIRRGAPQAAPQDAPPATPRAAVDELVERKAALKVATIDAFNQGEDTAAEIAHQYDSDLAAIEKQFVVLMNSHNWHMDDDNIQRDVYDGVNDDLATWSRLVQWGKVSPDLALAALDVLGHWESAIDLTGIAAELGIAIEADNVNSSCRKLLRVLHEDEIARKPGSAAAAIGTDERATMRSKIEAASELRAYISDLRDYV
jgi:hypothetical protein